MTDPVPPAEATPVDAPLALCYGTRPQVIKASVLSAELRRRWEVLSIDTGQHYDYELAGLLYEQLGVQAPDLLLGVGSGDHATQTAAVLTRAAEAFRRSRPWAAVVIGDTNSTLACALAAAKQRIPVVHVEAGLRASDPLMAEELNRRLVDAMSAVLCAPCGRAADRLRCEQVAGRVVVTGDIARDVLRCNLARAADGPADGWPVPPGRPFALVTLHRAELVDDPARLAPVMRALARLPLPVAFPAHPRTRGALDAAGLLPPSAGVHLLPPAGYLETVGCIRSAAVVITDSGGVQREAYWLGTPCITLRRETEWEDTVALGANTLAPPETVERLPELVAKQLEQPDRGWFRDAYGDGHAAARIAEEIAALEATLPRSRPSPPGSADRASREARFEPIVGG